MKPGSSCPATGVIRVFCEAGKSIAALLRHPCPRHHQPSRLPSPNPFFLAPDLHDYILNHGGGPDEVQQALIAATQALGPVARMQIAPEQGVFMEWLARVMGARRAIEVGTFTGYSALCLARGLGPQGRLLCLDVNEQWTRIAQTYWRQAGLTDRIALRLLLE